MNRSILLPVTCACFLASTVLTQPAKAEPGTQLKQTSRMEGEVDVLIGKGGIRATINKKSLVLLMTPPKWQLRLINIKDKKYFDVDPAKWTSPTSFAAQMYRFDSFRTLELGRGTAATLCGLQTTMYKISGDRYSPNRALSKSEKLSVASGTLWVLPDKQIPSSAVLVFDKLFNMPSSGSFPLQLRAVNHKGTNLHELVLDGAHPTTCSATDFQTPKDCKQAKTQNEVMVNSSTSSFVDDMTE